MTYVSKSTTEVSGVHTLMAYLEYRPHDFMALFAFMRGILGVFHLVTEFEQRIFNVVEAIWRWLSIAR